VGGGTGSKVAAGLPCPSCQEPVTVYLRSLRLWFTCAKCHLRLFVDADVPGLPSDTSFLEESWRELTLKAYEKERRHQDERAAACRRARRLLRGYLTQPQRRSYQRRRAVTLASRSVAGVRYLIEEKPTGAYVTALIRRDARGAVFRPPGHSPATVRRLPEQFTRSRVTLCLHPQGGLPPPDQFLALKLFLETDEARAWKKGTRFLLGLPPEAQV